MSFLFNSNEPYYYQIKKDILKKIERGLYSLGDQLPSEHQLVKEYGVSRPTIRQAIVDLVNDGVVVRGRGKGTFVSQPLITSSAQIFSTFAETMKKNQTAECSRLIHAEMIPASVKMAEELQIPAGSSVFEIVRLRLGNHEPLVIRTMQIAAAKFPGFMEEDLDAEPLYSIFQRKYGVNAISAVQSFQAVAATEREAELLKIEPGAPLLLWQGITYDADRVPIERVKALYRGDRFQFKISQGREMNSVMPSSEERGIGILDVI